MGLRAALHQRLKVGVFVKPLRLQHGGGSFLCGDPGTGEEWISELNRATEIVHVSVFVRWDWSLSQTTTVFISSAVSACRRWPQLGVLPVNLPHQSRYLREGLGVQKAGMGGWGWGELSPSMLALALPL